MPIDLPHKLTQQRLHGDDLLQRQVRRYLYKAGNHRHDQPERGDAARSWPGEEVTGTRVVGRRASGWVAVWQYRRKRAMRDEQTLNLQHNRALAIIDGDWPAKKAQFVKVADEEKAFDEKAYERR